MREMVEVEKVKENQIAIMHNALIEARYKLTLEEQRIIIAVISLIEPSDDELKLYKINVQTLQKLAGTKRKDIYRAVEEAIHGLLSKPIKVEIVQEGKRRFKMFNFISYGEYLEGEGYFLIGIDSRLKPFLLKLKERFTKIPLDQIFPLRSLYSIRMYELLKQYEGLKMRKFKLEVLRELLGIEENEYKDFRDFNKRILKKAVDEINKKTDIEIEYRKIRKNRKIEEIEFKIKPKNAKKEDSTKRTETPSQSPGIQMQKQAKNFNPADLWKNTLKILEYKYGVHTGDIDFLMGYTKAEYNAKVTPKEMIISPIDEAEEGNKELVKNMLEEFKSKIDKIVKIDTNGSYKFVIKSN